LKFGGGQVDLPLNNDYPAQSFFGSMLAASQIYRKMESACGRSESCCSLLSGEKLAKVAVSVGTTTAVS